jgi:tetratricopeptide (TPR) repeat protein
VAEELAQPFTSIAAHIAVAGVYLAAGEFSRAIAGLERAHSLCERGDFPVQRITVLARLGYAYAFSDRPVEGLALLEEGAQHIDRIDGFWRPRILGWLGETYLKAGRVKDASRVAERAAAITPPNAPIARAWTMRLAGDVASHGEHVDVERAARLYEDAAALADTLDLGFLLARCALGLGQLYRSAGDPRAREHLSAATDAFRAMDLAYWLSLAESELRVS